MSSDKRTEQPVSKVVEEKAGDLLLAEACKALGIEDPAHILKWSYDQIKNQVRIITVGGEKVKYSRNLQDDKIIVQIGQRKEEHYDKPKDVVKLNQTRIDGIPPKKGRLIAGRARG